MITLHNVYMGTLPPIWGGNKRIKTITFSITDECNLRCTYCYFKHKTHKNVMTFDTAKKAIDDILTDSSNNKYDGVIWDFIGGEPTLEMGLIDKISDYILYRMYELNHKWLYCYRFMIGTNGLLYCNPEFQQYIKKHRGNISVTVTIDGSKEKHDLSRIKKDGSGSYDDVKKIIPLWQKQFGGDSTKATFSHNDLPFLKDSIVNLWNMGVKCVAANIVFEDVWLDGDVDIYKEQLYELADYIIKNDLWDNYSVRFFDPNVGTPSTDISMRQNACGTGTMLAINTNGDYYPCVRFMPSAITKNSFEKLGSISQQISTDKLRVFSIINTKNQSPEKCLKCDIAGGCSWCSGFNYDVSSTGTLFERQTFLCEMHKANVEVNKYLWRNYELTKHKISPYRFKKISTMSPYNKFLYILCRSDFPSFCEYSNDQGTKNGSDDISYMDEEMLTRIINYCDENNYVPVLCGCSQLPKDYYGHQLVTYNSVIKGECTLNDNYITQLLIDVCDISENIDIWGVKNLILSAKASQIDQVLRCVQILCAENFGLNINLSVSEIDTTPEDYINAYKKLLDGLLEFVLERWSQKKFVSINVITNELVANTIRPCGSGYNSYAISPEGRFYICPGFYKMFPDRDLGSIDDGLENQYSSLCVPDKGPLCSECEIRHCKRCILKNKCGTGEYHIPTELQCVISHLEYEYSRKLSEKLDQYADCFPFEYNHHLKKHEHYDPLIPHAGIDYPNQGLDLFVKSLMNK